MRYLEFIFAIIGVLHGSINLIIHFGPDAALAGIQIPEEDAKAFKAIADKIGSQVVTLPDCHFYIGGQVGRGQCYPDISHIQKFVERLLPYTNRGMPDYMFVLPISEAVKENRLSIPKIESGLDKGFKVMLSYNRNDDSGVMSVPDGFKEYVSISADRYSLDITTFSEQGKSYRIHITIYFSERKTDFAVIHDALSSGGEERSMVNFVQQIINKAPKWTIQEVVQVYEGTSFDTLGHPRRFNMLDEEGNSHAIELDIRGTILPIKPGTPLSEWLVQFVKEPSLVIEKVSS